ncbi:multicopper oxidase domain-containing protein [Streptomyces sp. NPDC060035]|uniref:multicopper oxidase domain-containing protein n=1 Tax=Streptomyces sp. NPDC060035 TaxID=3347044 RepID=UPI00369FAA0C
MTEHLSRRSLIVGGVVATAGALIPLVRTLTPADALADGPSLPELAELDLRTPAGKPGTRTGTLTAGTADAGRLAYNRTEPGPLLRLREGDRVRLAFRNSLDAPTSLHVHGIPMTPATDAPLTHLMPGDSDVREFTLPPGSAGTYWYHPHAHGDVERQLLAGLAGPVVVTGPVDDQPALRDADDRLLTASARTCGVETELFGDAFGAHDGLVVRAAGPPTTGHGPEVTAG